MEPEPPQPPPPPQPQQPPQQPPRQPRIPGQIRPLDMHDLTAPSVIRLKTFVTPELKHHIREYDEDLPLGGMNKEALVQALYTILQDHVGEELILDDEAALADYVDAPVNAFDGPYPDEFDKLIDVMPKVVSVATNFGWAHLNMRGMAAAPPMTDTADAWRVYWGDNEYTVDQWNEKLDNWDNKYGAAPRVRRPIRVESIKLCWKGLEPVFERGDYNDVGGNVVAERFRKDMFGNVVTFEAGNKAMMGMVVDHIFPFARGGGCVDKNYMGLHHLANGRKSAHILQSLNPASMQVGFSVDDVCDLFKGLVSSDEYKNRQTRPAKMAYLRTYIAILERPLNGMGTPCRTFVERKNALMAEQGLTRFQAFKQTLDEAYLIWAPNAAVPAPVPAPAQV